MGQRKYTAYLAIPFFSFVTLCSCVSDNELADIQGAPGDAVAISVSSSALGGGMTDGEATRSVQGNKWYGNKGDNHIGIICKSGPTGTNPYTNVDYKNTGAPGTTGATTQDFEAAGDGIMIDNNDTWTFDAYYPYQEAATKTYTNFHVGSAMMYASGGKASKQHPTLKFNGSTTGTDNGWAGGKFTHLMAGLKFVINVEGDFDPDDFVGPADGSGALYMWHTFLATDFNFTPGSGSGGTVTPLLSWYYDYYLNKSGESWNCGANFKRVGTTTKIESDIMYIAPGSYSASTNDTFSVTTKGGKSYTCTLSQSDVPLVANQLVTVTVTILSNKISVTNISYTTGGNWSAGSDISVDF